MSQLPGYGHWFLRARLKTRQLFLLTALAEEGNIHAAARLLNVTQPAASKLLKDLEDVLGVQLFERLPRGMRATWYGETMIRHAREALASLNQAHDEIESLKAGRFGQVGVGAITSPGHALLPPAVAMIKREQPSLRVMVEVETSPVLLERLRQGKLDIVVGRFFAGEDQNNLSYEPLTTEPVCAVARPGHPLATAKGLTLDQVVGGSWIVPPAGSVLRHRFDLMFQECRLTPPMDIVESAAILYITRMLQQSDMLCVMASEVARYYASHGILTILPLDMPCHMDDFGIITRTDRQLSPGGALMHQALRATAQTVYGLKL